MDEGKKAASVAQLKELHDAVVPRLDALEAEDKGESEDSAKVDALSSQLMMLQQKMDKCDAMCEQMMAKLNEPVTPVDLTPILTLITKAMTDMAAMNARPVTRTGEAILPDGGRIRLQVSDTTN